MPDILADLDFKNVSRIRNLPSPLNNDEPVRLADLNSAIEGLAWKDSVRVATQSNINLTSPGATIDGVTLSVGDRVLVKSQTATAENGIYIFNGATTPMTRSADANTAAELEQAVVTVEEGSSAGVTYRQTQVNFTLGTDPVLWTTFGTSAPPASETTAGIAEIATQAETDAGIDDQRIVTPLKLANWAGRIRKYTSTIGDGSSTQIDLTHNFNTRDVIVQVYKTSGNYDQIYCDVKAITTNIVRLNFSSAPASNSLRVIIMA
jgi:hypothetical protein